MCDITRLKEQLQTSLLTFCLRGDRQECPLQIEGQADRYLIVENKSYSNEQIDRPISRCTFHGCL